MSLEQRTKRLETSKKFNRQRKEDFERIISDEGCLFRVNRSIQAEGSFAQIKQDINFRRFMCRGQKNVLAESILERMNGKIFLEWSKPQKGTCFSFLLPKATGELVDRERIFEQPSEEKHSITKVKYIQK